MHYAARDLATRRDALEQAESALEVTSERLSAQQREAGQMEESIAELRKVKVELEVACGVLRDEQAAAAAQRREYRDTAAQTAAIEARVTHAACQAGAGIGTLLLCRDAEVQCTLSGAQPAAAADEALPAQQHRGSSAGGGVTGSSWAGARHVAAGQLKVESAALDDEVASMQEAVAAAKCARCLIVHGRRVRVA